MRIQFSAYVIRSQGQWLTCDFHAHQGLDTIRGSEPMLLDPENVYLRLDPVESPNFWQNKEKTYFLTFGGDI